MALLLLAAGVLLLSDSEEQLALTSSQAPTSVEAGEIVAEWVGGPLLVKNRDHLSLCVDDAGEFNISDTNVEAVRAALAAMLAVQPEVPIEYTNGVVTKGCPPISTRLGTPNPYVGLAAERYYQGGGSPSEHLAFVYLVSRDVYAATFGDQPYVQGREEFICGGDVCVVATVGLYFPETVEADVLEAGLLRALVLPRPEIPDPVIDWSACELGEQPHPDYPFDQDEECLA